MSTEIEHRECGSCGQQCVVTEDGALARHRLPAPREKCKQCRGQGDYQTGWGDSMEHDILEAATGEERVTIKCPSCQGTGKQYIVVDGVMTLGEWCPPLGIHHPDESL